jgi:hypothetical protein
VLYLAAEDDFDELHRRQADINDGLGVGMGDYEELASCIANSDLPVPPSPENRVTT